MWIGQEDWPLTSPKSGQGKHLVALDLVKELLVLRMKSGSSSLLCTLQPQSGLQHFGNNGQAIAPLLPKSSTGVRHCSVAGERPKLIAADTATTTTSHKNGFPGKSWFPLQILHTNFDRIWDNMELPNKGLDSVISKLNQAVLYERSAVQIGERSLPQCSAQILQRRPPSIKNGFSIKSEF